MKILLTGGLGYIGSHTAVELLENGYDVVIVDDLSNSSRDVADKIMQITGKKIKFYCFDVKDKAKLCKVFKKEKIEQVVHFAGFKAVGESVKQPLMYYGNNLGATITLLDVMQQFGVNNLIFSSSATVYGKPEKLPIKETAKLECTNPYGRTKLFAEEILRDFAYANPSFNCVILRYFNPVGAHSSGIIGENPNGVPNNLMPYITKVAFGKLEKLNVFGNDYDTHDGTGVRDYIHVVDLAIAHRLAVEKNKCNEGLKIYNVGTGKGYSVLDMVKAFEKSNGVKIKYEITERRPGDVASCYASNAKAQKELGFKAKLGLKDMCKSCYEFEKQLKQ